jgi:2-C-methyl-D-erythritol 2,4-cyclodiphosphate synthase
MLRVGQGYDLHRLAMGCPLWVGGLHLESVFGSVAHSDGDALVHAVIDAILSPLGLGDIGKLFPDADPRWKNADSVAMLASVKERFLAEVVVLSLDAVVVLDSPKIGPHTDAMRARIAGALGIPVSRVNVKGKTTENTQAYVYEAMAVCLMDDVRPEKQE